MPRTTTKRHRNSIRIHFYGTDLTRVFLERLKVFYQEHLRREVSTTHIIRRAIELLSSYTDRLHGRQELHDEMIILLRQGR